MRGDRVPGGFTLIEVLIVVVIVAILAGTIITNFGSSTDDARKSSMKSNLRTMRSQIELYSVDHDNTYPQIQGNDLPQLYRATDAAGQMDVSGPLYPHGPYIDAIPINPYDSSNKVTAVAVAGQDPTGPVGTLGGWQYDPSTGEIWPNHKGYAP
jgi:prepilin-type N-terminal cleavage/methylation domain-containing protein